MNLAIDIGNTTAKLGLFEESQLRRVVEKADVAAALDLVQANPVRHCIICSVGLDPATWQEKLQPYVNTIYVLNDQLPVPLHNHYETPQTLGMDRLAAVAGATALYPARPCLVVDLGTCITYDAVDATGNYYGGSISPGLRMRFRAMHTFTARLPLLEPDSDAPLIGRNTQSAMQSGVLNGMTAELTGIIGRYAALYPDLVTLLCGGDALFFESRIKGSIFAVPELVLIGLNRILLHNVSPL